jgi:hypothetical protein
MRTLKLSIAIALAFILSGCATAARIQTPPRDAAVCCTRLVDMPFTPIDRGSTDRVTFDESAMLFRFDKGLGTFKAYALPSGVDRILEMETDLSSGYMPSATILRPLVLFLDADKQPQQTVSNPQWRDHLMILRGTYWRSEVPVPNSAKYVVIYNVPEIEQYSIAFSANGKMYKVPVAYTGSLSVEIK